MSLSMECSQEKLTLKANAIFSTGLKDCHKNKFDIGQSPFFVRLWSISLHNSQYLHNAFKAEASVHKSNIVDDCSRLQKQIQYVK